MRKHDECSTIRRFTTIRSIQEFAALWCGASEDDLDIVLQNTYGGGSGAMRSLIVESDDFPCLKPRIRFIIDAIRENRVECCDELGNFRGNENIAWSRMCLRLDKAREWLENSALPRNELPDFLFQSQAENFPITQKGLEDAQNKIRELEEIIKQKDVRIAELEQQTIDIDKNGPINSERWKHSCRAIAKAFAAYIEKQYLPPITKKEFTDFIKSRVENFKNPIGVAEEIAWQEFPQKLKCGPGRPPSNQDYEVPF